MPCSPLPPLSLYPRRGKKFNMQLNPHNARVRNPLYRSPKQLAYTVDIRCLDPSASSCSVLAGWLQRINTLAVTVCVVLCEYVVLCCVVSLVVLCLGYSLFLFLLFHSRYLPVWLFVSVCLSFCLFSPLYVCFLVFCVCVYISKHEGSFMCLWVHSNDKEGWKSACYLHH